MTRRQELCRKAAAELAGKVAWNFGCSRNELGQVSGVWRPGNGWSGAAAGQTRSPPGSGSECPATSDFEGGAPALQTYLISSCAVYEYDEHPRPRYRVLVTGLHGRHAIINRD